MAKKIKVHKVPTVDNADVEKVVKLLADAKTPDLKGYDLVDHGFKTGSLLMDLGCEIVNKVASQVFERLKSPQDLSNFDLNSFGNVGASFIEKGSKQISTALEYEDRLRERDEVTTGDIPVEDVIEQGKEAIKVLESNRAA